MTTEVHRTKYSVISIEAGSLKFRCRVCGPRNGDPMVNDKDMGQFRKFIAGMPKTVTLMCGPRPPSFHEMSLEDFDALPKHDSGYGYSIINKGDVQ
jgi:hypothetical protein